MPDAKLIVNDKEIPLNPIIKNILINIIKGFIETLKKVPEEKKTISIEIEL